MSDKLSKKLIKILKELRRWEVRTLDGYKPIYELCPNDEVARQMYNSLTEELEIISREIGANAKTRIREEYKERNLPVPDFSKEGIRK